MKSIKRMIQYETVIKQECSASLAAYGNLSCGPVLALPRLSSHIDFRPLGLASRLLHDAKLPSQHAAGRLASSCPYVSNKWFLLNLENHTTYHSEKNEFHAKQLRYHSEKNEFHVKQLRYHSEKNEFHADQTMSDSLKIEFHADQTMSDSLKIEFHVKQLRYHSEKIELSLLEGIFLREMRNLLSHT